MAENGPKPTPEAPLWNHFPWLDLCFPLRPESPRAIPITRQRDDGYELSGLRFETLAGAEDFAKGLEGICDRDGERVFLRTPPAINRDERGNCWGIN